MTNYEKYFGTPVRAAKIIHGIRHIWPKNMDFEKAWLDWYGKKARQTSIEDMPSPTECMAEWLHEECDG